MKYEIPEHEVPLYIRVRFSLNYLKELENDREDVSYLLVAIRMLQEVAKELELKHI